MKRLLAIANKIREHCPSCKLLIDVGCDHGILAEYIVKHDLSNKVIASDKSSKCLEKAAHKACERLELRCGDGLSVLKDGEVPCVTVIAGMGGMNIIEILDKPYSPALVLSPHRDIDKVRAHIIGLGYKILSDTIVQDRKKCYTIIVGRREHG